MTESIAPDTAGKLAPTPKPVVSPPPLKIPDKTETAAKTDSAAKPSATPDAPAPAAGALPPSTVAGSPSALGRGGYKKQTAIVASALFSLIAGIAGVRLMWPATDDTKTAQAPNQTVPDNSKPSSTPTDDSKQSSTPTAHSTTPTEPTRQTGTNIPPTGLPLIPVPPNSLPAPTVQQQSPYPPPTFPQSPTEPQSQSGGGQPNEKAGLHQYPYGQQGGGSTSTNPNIPLPGPLPPPSSPIPSSQSTWGSGPVAPTQSSGSPGTVGSPLGYGGMPITPLPPPNLPSPNMPSPNLLAPGALPSVLPTTQTPNTLTSQPPPVSPATQGTNRERPGSESTNRERPGFNSSFNRTNSNSTSGMPSPSFPEVPGASPSPVPGVAPTGSQILAMGGFQAPGGPANPGTTPQSSPMMPTVPPVTPTVPSPTVPTVPYGGPAVPTIPNGPAVPSGGPAIPPVGGQSTTTPVVIPPPGDLNFKPSAPGQSGTGLQGSSTGGSPNIPSFSGTGGTSTPPHVLPESPVTPKGYGAPASPLNNSGNGTGTSGTSGTGSVTHLTKPPASPPAVVERSPTTSYDVDLYELKANDTWETISQEFYNDKRYAAALQAANSNKPLSGGMVDIPPIYVLKQKFQAPAGTRAPTSQVVPPASPPPSWTPASTTPATSSSGSKTYKVPPGGITMRAIARNFLGNEQRWQEIYNLNPQWRPDAAIPEGTEVRLPMDAKLPG